ncbi:MAG: DUF3160 domain-containing protein [Aminobacteriaceae bacterium]
MPALREDLDMEPESAWFSSIGTAWMNLLWTLTYEYSEGYPLYMQSPLFAAKQLEAQLGSYTELRHDTILYEKPNYAELGDGWEEEPLKISNEEGANRPLQPFSDWCRTRCG